MKGRANVTLVHNEQIVPLWVFHQCKLNCVRDCADIVATDGYLLIWRAYSGSCGEHDAERGDQEAHGAAPRIFFTMVGTKNPRGPRPHGGQKKRGQSKNGLREVCPYANGSFFELDWIVSS